MQYLMNTRPCMKFSAVFHPPCSGVKISRAYHWYDINEFFFLPNLPLFCSYRFISNFLYRCTIGVIFVFLIIGEIHPLHPKSQFLQNMQQLWHTLLGGGLKSRYGGIFGNVDTSTKSILILLFTVSIYFAFICSQFTSSQILMKCHWLPWFVILW